MGHSQYCIMHASRKVSKLPQLLLLLLLIGLAHSTVIRKSESEKNSWDLNEALTATSELAGFNGTWISDDEFYYTTRNKSLCVFNVATRNERTIVESSVLSKYLNAAFAVSLDIKDVLIRHNIQSVYRHTYTAKCDIYNLDTKKTISIRQGEDLQYCALLPLSRVLYVYENNVYIHYNDSLESALTADGITGIVYNGIPDWVYEEEVLASASALWWSEDGDKVAVGFFNDTEVRTFSYEIYGDGNETHYQYPHEVKIKYPKPGTVNPSVKIRVFDLTIGKDSMVEIQAPTDVVSSDHILQNVIWSSNTHILVTWLNRKQNVASLQHCDYKGACVEVKQFSEPNGWVSLDEQKCLTTDLNCLFIYWIDDWYQVWNLDLKTGTNIWKSRGNFTVLSIYGYDKTNDKLYYKATDPADPSIYHVYSNNDCLSCSMVDEDGTPCLSASASFSTSYSYYRITCSGPSPAYTQIFKASTHSSIYDWELNTAFRQKVATKLLPNYSFMRVQVSDGSSSIVKLALPAGFDKSKKYPVVVNVYGGPNSVRVTNGFSVGYESYLLSNKEVIYAYIDGRGSGNKGKNMLFSVYQDLGHYEVDDQLFVAKWMKDNLNYVDAEHFCIWGWSYGGYVTGKVIEADKDKVFTCGISVAPVTSWFYYDSIYTERYMNLPEANKEKYETSNLYKNGKIINEHSYMLVHGTADDNVHFQHFVMLAKYLQRDQIYYDEVVYPDEAHAIRNRLTHLYETITAFFTEHLNLS